MPSIEQRILSEIYHDSIEKPSQIFIKNTPSQYQVPKKCCKKCGDCGGEDDEEVDYKTGDQKKIALLGHLKAIEKILNLSDADSEQIRESFKAIESSIIG